MEVDTLTEQLPHPVLCPILHTLPACTLPITHGSAVLKSIFTYAHICLLADQLPHIAPLITHGSARLMCIFRCAGTYMSVPWQSSFHIVPLPHLISPAFTPVDRNITDGVSVNTCWCEKAVWAPWRPVRATTPAGRRTGSSDLSAGS